MQIDRELKMPLKTAEKMRNAIKKNEYLSFQNVEIQLPHTQKVEGIKYKVALSSDFEYCCLVLFLSPVSIMNAL